MACLASTRANALASRRSAPRASVRPSRTPMVVRAFSVQDAFDWVGKGFVKIFSKPESTVDSRDTNWAQTDFSGKISHSPRRPFKDGWSASEASSAALAEANKAEQAEAGEGYLDGAVKRVVNNNFTGDATEPEWGAAQGWKGDIHTTAGKRDSRDGFHTKKM